VTSTEPTVYEQVGGEPFFISLTAAFYRGVESDPIMRALYPEGDLTPAELRLRLFLEQYWGGPTTYHEMRGHPKLRMRHAPFPINVDMRNRWLTHMAHALSEQHLSQELEDTLWRYFTMAAISMENIPEGDPVERAFIQTVSDQEKT